MAKITQHDFDWSVTNRRVVMFIPNFKRKNLLIPTLKRFKTTLPDQDWIFLVVNDGPHEDLSDLAEYNLAYFTFERDPAVERNGCMIRNYVLKRLQCEVMTTRDPEIFTEGEDHIERVAKIKDIIYRPIRMVELQEPETPKILANPTVSVEQLGHRAIHTLRNPMEPRAFHAGFAAHVKRLMDIGGYDEDFADYYGWEDIDILHRLVQSGADIYVDNKVSTYHIWHMRRQKFLKTVRDNGLAFESKRKKNELVANEGKEWGNG